MRTNPQIEHEVGEIVDRVLANRPIEDSNIELKSEWPTDHRKAAWQIAGLCNAARMAPAMWIVGIDEKTRTTVGAKNEELADWWPQVQSHFCDGHAPGLHNVVCPGYEDANLVALEFDTSQPPYMVKVTKEDTRWIERVLPWREGNSTRAANRRDVLRLAVPASKLPDIEITSAGLQLGNKRVVEGQDVFEATLQANMFVVPKSETSTIIAHRSLILVRWEGKDLPGKVSRFQIGEEGRRDGSQYRAVIRHIDHVHLRSEVRLPDSGLSSIEAVQVHFELAIAEADSAAIPCDIELIKCGDSWAYNAR